MRKADRAGRPGLTFSKGGVRSYAQAFAAAAAGGSSGKGESGAAGGGGGGANMANMSARSGAATCTRRRGAARSAPTARA